MKVHLDLSLSYVGIPEVTGTEETDRSGKISFDKLPFYFYNIQVFKKSFIVKFYFKKVLQMKEEKMKGR